jgi:DNA-binding XRE family transcriptional regulator
VVAVGSLIICPSFVRHLSVSSAVTGRQRTPLEDGCRHDHEGDAEADLNLSVIVAPVRGRVLPILLGLDIRTGLRMEAVGCCHNEERWKLSRMEAKRWPTQRWWPKHGLRLVGSWRPAAGLSQEQLAPLSGHSRSTVANAETGRQRAPREFWKLCDAALGTGTALTRGYDEVQALQRHSHVHEAAVAQQDRVVTGPRSPRALRHLRRSAIDRETRRAWRGSSRCGCGWMTRSARMRSARPP